MTARQGRGRPATFTPEVQKRFLAAVAAGARLKDAAAEVGVSANVPSQHAARNHEFATALTAARAAGREARRAAAAHDESRYTNQACRCPKCTSAASTARMARKARAKEENQPPALTTVPGAKSPTSFLLLNCSSPPSTTAA